MIKYPDDLPYPQRDGYDLSPVSPLIRSTLQTGRARQRRRYTSTPTIAAVNWLMDDMQAQFFEAWFKEVLVDGSQWFECPLKSPVGLTDYTVRFTNMYSGPTLVGVSMWRFTASLELRERPLIQPGWAQFPDLWFNMNIIDMALNREWPEA